MNELEKEVREETAEETVEETVSPKEENTPAGGTERGNRSHILWLIAGAYLVYNGFTLCRNVLEGAEGTSWAFALVGIVFMALGAGLVVLGLKGMAEKNRKDRNASEKPAEKTEEKEVLKPSDPSSAKMSISQRARIVESLGEVNEEGEESRAENEAENEEAQKTDSQE